MQGKFYLTVILLVFAGISNAAPLGTAITYQGQLKQDGASSDGLFDFQFELFNVDVGGLALSVPLVREDVTVIDGVFTVELDFGPVPFAGDQLWLAIGVREGGSAGGYTGLLPRQKVTAVPYALRAVTVTIDAVDDADADVTNELQDLSLKDTTLSLSNDLSTVDLSGFLDNTDFQDLTLNGNTLSLTGDSTPVDLSSFLNTDNQTLTDVLAQGNDAGGQSLVNIQNLTAAGTTTTNALTLTGLDCTTNENGGALTASASGVVSCSDDANVSNTLDGAYDQGGAGAGRTITADSGPVTIQGTDGLALDGGDLLQLPGDPTLSGSLGIGAIPFSVVVSGRYAYVVDLASADLKVIDVSNPSAPSLIGSLSIGASSSVYVSGRYAYVLDVTSGALKVIDVSNPSAPSLAGSLSIGVEPTGVHVSGRYAYVTDQISGDVKVIDVSDPSAPSLAGSIAVGPTPSSLAVSGRYAYVVDISSSDLKVIDVSNPDAPGLAGSLAIGSGPISVYVSGRYAYVVDSISGDLNVIDVSDPSAPSLAGSLSIGAQATDVYVSGRYAYVIDRGSDDLKVIDVSDPSAPGLAASLGIGLSPTSLAVSGRYAYVVDESSDDLKVIEIAGADVTSLTAHSMEAGNLQVRNDIIAQGQLQVTGGLSVGSGGLVSDGNVGISGDVGIVGNVGIGTTNPINILEVAAASGTGFVDSSGNFVDGSSREYKDEVRDLDLQSAQDALRELDPVRYFGKNSHDDEHLGFIAEDVPDLVAHTGRKGLRAMDIVAVLTKIVQEQQENMEALKVRIESLGPEGEKKDLEIMQLKAANKAMERRLAALERRLK